MPTHDRVGSYDRGNVLECLASQDLTLDCEAPTLVIVEQDTLLANLLLQNLVLGT